MEGARSVSTATATALAVGFSMQLLFKWILGFLMLDFWTLVSLIGLFLVHTQIPEEAPPEEYVF